MKTRATLGLVLGLLFATRARAAGRGLPPGYIENLRIWHAPAPRPRAGRPALVLEMVNTGERLELAPLHDNGGFSAEDVLRASRALRDRHSNKQHALEPRLLDLAYRVQRHFGVGLLRVLSGYRAAQGSPSPHSQGRAFDFIVPGQRDAEVARFARTLGFTGVGLYTVSGFVHLDSRSRSYFWVDASGPGSRCAARPAFVREAAAADARALARGETRPQEAPSEEEGTDGDDEEAVQGEDATEGDAGTAAAKDAPRARPEPRP